MVELERKDGVARAPGLNPASQQLLPDAICVKSWATTGAIALGALKR